MRRYALYRVPVLVCGVFVEEEEEEEEEGMQ